MRVTGTSFDKTFSISCRKASCYLFVILSLIRGLVFHLTHERQRYLESERLKRTAEHFVVRKPPLRYLFNVYRRGRCVCLALMKRSVQLFTRN